MWVSTEGEHIVVNVVEGMQKARYVARDPRVARRSEHRSCTGDSGGMRARRTGPRAGMCIPAVALDPEGAERFVRRWVTWIGGWIAGEALNWLGLSGDPDRIIS